MKSAQPETQTWTAEHEAAASAELRRWIERNCSTPAKASKKIKRHSGIVAALISAAINDAGIPDRVVGVSAATLNDYDLQVMSATSAVGHVTRRISLTAVPDVAQSKPPRKAVQAKPVTGPRRQRDHKETYRRRNEKAQALGYSSYAAMRKATSS